MQAATTKPVLHDRRRMLSFVAAVPVLMALLLASLAAPLCGAMPRAQRHEGRHEIDHLEEVWRSALLKGSIAALDSLLADDYMAISPSGMLQSKEQTLANLRQGTLHFNSLEISDRKVRFYGATALVTSRAEVDATTAEGSVSGSYRYTRVYVRNEHGDWKIVSFEASRIREPGERRQAEGSLRPAPAPSPR